MKKIFATILFTFICAIIITAQTRFIKTKTQFENKETVYQIIHNNYIVGEWWPVTALDFFSRKSSLEFFDSSLEDLLKSSKINALVPDGMTSAVSSGYTIEGQYLIDGVRYNQDQPFPEYGMIILEDYGRSIRFAHRNDYPDNGIETLFRYYQGKESVSILFLPVVKRGDRSLQNNTSVHRALVRRDTYDGEQLGVVVLDEPMSYIDLLSVFQGLDYRSNGGATTTHIYFLDGGATWGEVGRKSKEGKITTFGSRNRSAVTNYLVLY